MKIEEQKHDKKFVPIQITIETEIELDLFLYAFQQAAEYSSPTTANDLEKCAMRIAEAVGK